METADLESGLDCDAHAQRALPIRNDQSPSPAPRIGEEERCVGQFDNFVITKEAVVRYMPCIRSWCCYPSAEHMPALTE